MTESLRVDSAVLEHLHLSLAALARSFEGLHERREELEKIWGSHAMRSAMGDFADNWTTHRDKLRGKIEELAEHCEGTVRCFREVDTALTSAFGPTEIGPR